GDRDRRLEDHTFYVRHGDRHTGAQCPQQGEPDQSLEPAARRRWRRSIDLERSEVSGEVIHGCSARVAPTAGDDQTRFVAPVFALLRPATVGTAASRTIAAPRPAASKLRRSSSSTTSAIHTAHVRIPLTDGGTLGSGF